MMKSWLPQLKLLRCLVSRWNAVSVDPGPRGANSVKVATPAPGLAWWT